jgi:hypothetical protein
MVGKKTPPPPPGPITFHPLNNVCAFVRLKIKNINAVNNTHLLFITKKIE